MFQPNQQSAHTHTIAQLFQRNETISRARYTHCCSASQTSRPEEPLTNAEHKRLSSLLATDRHFMTLEISAGQSAFSHLARHSAATCPTSCCGLTTMVDDQFFFPHTHFVHFLVDLLWTRPRTTTTTISFGTLFSDVVGDGLGQCSG